MIMSTRTVLIWKKAHRILVTLTALLRVETAVLYLGLLRRLGRRPGDRKHNQSSGRNQIRDVRYCETEYWVKRDMAAMLTV